MRRRHGIDADIGERRLGIDRIGDPDAGPPSGRPPVDLEGFTGRPLPRERARPIDPERDQLLAPLAAARQRDHRLAERLRVEPVHVRDGAACTRSARRAAP
jgi:hypothetical protein